MVEGELAHKLKGPLFSRVWRVSWAVFAIRSHYRAEFQGGILETLEIQQI